VAACSFITLLCLSTNHISQCRRLQAAPSESEIFMHFFTCIYFPCLFSHSVAVAVKKYVFCVSYTTATRVFRSGPQTSPQSRHWSKIFSVLIFSVSSLPLPLYLLPPTQQNTVVTSGFGPHANFCSCSGQHSVFLVTLDQTNVFREWVLA
jgi:hypothetical protein